MSLDLSAISCVVIIFLSVIIALMLGKMILVSFLDVRINSFLYMGMSFFVGIGCFLSYCKLFIFGLDFRLICLSFLLLLFISFKTLDHTIMELFNKNSIIGSIFTFTLMAFLVAIIWIYPQNYGPDSSPHSSFGSIESGRYGNISLYILNNFKIPVLGQNYGQSIISASSQLLVGAKPQLALYLWTSVGLGFLSILIYGILQHLINSKFSSFIAWFIFIFGAVSASFKHVMVSDSGWPIPFIGYFDMAYGIGSGLVFVFFLLLNYEKFKISTISAFYISVLIMPSWTLSAPQNFPVAVIVLLFLQIMLSNENNKSFMQALIQKNSLFYVAIFCSCIFLVLLPFGGIFTPSQFVDNVNIPGIMSLPPGSFPKINLALDYLIFHSDAPGFSFSHISHAPFNFTMPLFNLVMLTFTRTLEAIYIIFYPLLGLLGSFLLLRSLEISIEQKFHLDIKMFKKILILSTMIFIVTVIPTFILQIGDEKWGLSRFSVPGIIYGQLCLCITIGFLLKINNSNRIIQSYIFMFLIFMTTPSVVSLLYRVYYNLEYSFTDGYNTLLSLSSTIWGG